MSRPQLAFEDTLVVLERVRRSEIVVVGGQAVGFWVARYSMLPELPDRQLLYSKDIDVLGSAVEAKTIATALGGQLRLNPNLEDLGRQLGVVKAPMIGSEHEVVVDILSGILGVETREAIDWSVPVETPSGGSFRVLHPLHVLQSRIANVVVAPEKYNVPRGRAQLQAAIAIMRAFGSELIDNGRLKDVRNLNKTVFTKARHHEQWRRIPFLAGMEPFDAICRDPRLPAQFHSIGLPKMTEQIAAQRARDRQRWGQIET